MGPGIRIDKEGVWYYNGAEMIRKDIIMSFARNLICDETGKYLIELDNERCYVEVEDTPFVVRKVSFIQSPGKDYFSALLSDDSIEELDLNSLSISDANILYCTVKNNKFRARFSRPAYYQLAAYIKHDSSDDRYYVTMNGSSYHVANART